MSRVQEIGPGRRVDFARVNQAAGSVGPEVLRALFPQGRLEGREWVFLNPNRPDKSLGSCKANVDTGKGGDFAQGVHWGDFVGAAAFASGLSQRDAAIRLAATLGVDPYA